MINKKWILIFCFFYIASCSSSVVIEKRLDAIDSTNIAIEKKYKYLTTQILKLNSHIGKLEANEVTIDPTEKGFSVIRIENGYLYLSCDNIASYGDGQKLELRIGNPQNVTFNGFDMTVRYGPRPPEVPEDSTALDHWALAYNEWLNNSIRTKQLAFTDNLVPGKWNKITLILAPAKVEQVGFIGIKIQTDQVTLFR